MATLWKVDPEIVTSSRPPRITTFPGSHIRNTFVSPTRGHPTSSLPSRWKGRAQCPIRRPLIGRWRCAHCRAPPQGPGIWSRSTKPVPLQISDSYNLQSAESVRPKLSHPLDPPTCRRCTLENKEKCPRGINNVVRCCAVRPPSRRQMRHSSRVLRRRESHLQVRLCRERAITDVPVIRLKARRVVSCH